MNQHYYTENPTSEIKEKIFTQSIKGESISFKSVSGVFSFEEKVDKASELLIKNFSPTGKTILDMGCGYGAIGLFIKANYNNTTVYMTDINNRAIDYTKYNASKNGLSITAIQSDLYSSLEGISFDDIVSNPPIAAGKKLNTQLINDAWDHLNENGALWLVAFHNKGGETLKNIMKMRFGNVEDIEKSGGIRVYKSIKQHSNTF